ncbi:MAG: hypothetical protein Q4G27_07370 [Flavobacteriaceae bacterium]|nr:hypothetical protein [Flavobacteriaceae bacterium]
MKNIFLNLLLLGFFIGFISCDSDDDQPQEINPVQNLNLLKEITANGHTIEIYGDLTKFTVGYNDLYFRLKESNGNYSNQWIITDFKPVMHMTDRMHSCPVKLPETTQHHGLKKGFAIFQMPSNADEYWEINMIYSLNNSEFSITDQIHVVMPAENVKTVSSFMGTDNSRYVLAYIAPKSPAIAVNDITAVLYKMQDMMNFVQVENFQIQLDPRMPGMGNHGSPNNQDLSWYAQERLYKGKLSLTMTGYWKLNLIVKDSAGNVVKGEAVTDENESSSVFWELTF